MKVAVSQRVDVDPRHGEQRDALARDWAAWIAGSLADATCLPVPNLPAGASAWYASVRPDLVILSGGNDLGTCPVREETEEALVAAALADGVPVLGVCRGMQLLNRHIGGELSVDVAARSGRSHAGSAHDVELSAAVAGFAPGTRITVNSFHDHGVLEPDVAPALGVLATCGEVVEALEHPDLPVLGVQWHPERIWSGASSELDAALSDRLMSAGSGR